MVPEAHWPFTLLSVLLVFCACEPAKKGSEHTAEPRPKASRPTPAKTAHARALEPFEIGPYGNRLQYDNDALYWLQSRPDRTRELVRRNLATGSQQTLAAGEISDFAVGPSKLVRIEGHRIVAHSLEGKQERVLADHQADAVRIAVDATHAYWIIGDTRHVRIGPTHPGSVRRARLDGGPVQTLLDDTSAGLIALMEDDLYASHHGIAVISKSGGTPRPLALGSGLNDISGPPVAMRVLGGALYAAIDNTAYRILPTEGLAEALYAADILLDAIPVDDRRTIVARNSSYARLDVAQTGAIVLVEDGEATILAECERPLSVAVAPGTVYFIDSPISEEKPPTLRSVALPAMR